MKRKLLCSQVKVGSQVGQILSGVRRTILPEEMVGKGHGCDESEPAKLARMVSEGMLHCAEGRWGGESGADEAGEGYAGWGGIS